VQKAGQVAGILLANYCTSLSQHYYLKHRTLRATWLAATISR